MANIPVFIGFYTYIYIYQLVQDLDVSSYSSCTHLHDPMYALRKSGTRRFSEGPGGFQKQRFHPFRFFLGRPVTLGVGIYVSKNQLFTTKLCAKAP